jgi:hypothetical protein
VWLLLLELLELGVAEGLLELLGNEEELLELMDTS